MYITKAINYLQNRQVNLLSRTSEIEQGTLESFDIALAPYFERPF